MARQRYDLGTLTAFEKQKYPYVEITHISKKNLYTCKVYRYLKKNLELTDINSDNRPLSSPGFYLVLLSI